MENKQLVYLRALEPDDYKTSIAWRKDDKIWSLLGGPKYFVSEEYERQWVIDTIHQTKDIKLAICTVGENKYIGNAYLTNIDWINRKAESHILIGDHDYWGHGYGTDAYSQLLDFAFNQRNLHRVQALVLEDNIASQKLHEKLGFVKEGILRDSVFKDGRYKSQIVYGLVKNQ
jgi:RimJ/RimL family protein N-acetyltransferase